MRFAACMAAVALLGCNQAPPAGQQEPAPVTDASPVVEEIDLVGHWRVAGIDGKEVDEPRALALRIDEEHIWWEPSCAGEFRLYRISGTGFSASAEPGPGGPICTIPRAPELPRLWSAFEASDTIERTPENGVKISGGGRSVTLFSQ